MKQWVGNAHGDQSVRCACEKRVGHFDIRGGLKTGSMGLVGPYLSHEQREPCRRRVFDLRCEMLRAADF